MSDIESCPSPIGTNRNIGDIPKILLFQQSVRQICAQSNYTPVPLIFFYNKANLDSKGGLAVAPIMFILRFLGGVMRGESFLWHVLAYISKLHIRKVRSLSKDSKVKRREHKQVLSLVVFQTSVHM